MTCNLPLMPPIRADASEEDRLKAFTDYALKLAAANPLYAQMIIAKAMSILEKRKWQLT